MLYKFMPILMVVGFLAGFFGAEAYKDDARNQCKVEALKALKDPAKIKELCR